MRHSGRGGVPFRYNGLGRPLECAPAPRRRLLVAQLLVAPSFIAGKGSQRWLARAECAVGTHMHTWYKVFVSGENMYFFFNENTGKSCCSSGPLGTALRRRPAPSPRGCSSPPAPPRAVSRAEVPAASPHRPETAYTIYGVCPKAGVGIIPVYTGIYWYEYIPVVCPRHP